jgi:hypothetical protein
MAKPAAQEDRQPDADNQLAGSKPCIARIGSGFPGPVRFAFGVAFEVANESSSAPAHNPD